MTKTRRPFSTGSRIYGSPTEKSDYDMVVLVEPSLKDKMITYLGIPFRFGDLNLILVTSEAEYDAWEEARNLCMEVKAKQGFCDKETAIRIHEETRDKYGVEPLSVDSGSPETRAEARSWKGTWYLG